MKDLLKEAHAVLVAIDARTLPDGVAFAAAQVKRKIEQALAPAPEPAPVKKVVKKKAKKVAKKKVVRRR